MIELKCENILIEPVNHRLAPMVMKRIVKGEIKYYAIEYTTSKWKKCKKLLGDIFSQQYTEEQKAELDQGHISIRITVETYKDIDSLLKIIFDVLEEIKLIDNDRYIHEALIVKRPCKRGQPEKLNIRIC